MNPELYNAAIHGSQDFGAKLKYSTTDYEQLITSGRRNTILHLAAESGKLQIEEGDDHVLRFLYEQNKKGDTPLHIAAKLGNLEMTRILVAKAKKTDIKQNRKLLSMGNHEKDTALHVAVRHNRFQVVMSLIVEDKGLASIENAAGESPLFIAVERYFFQVGFHILDSAPDCSLAGRSGMNVLHAAVIRSESSWALRKLHRCFGYNKHFYSLANYLLKSSPNLSNKYRDIVHELLKRFQGHLIMEKADDFGWIPLHYAAFVGHKDLVDLLLAKGNGSLALTRNKQVANWKTLWKSKLHERLKFHCWRMLAGVLLTRTAIVERTGIGEPSCYFCGADAETNLHVFKNCQLGRLLAFGSRWGCRLDLWKGDNIYELLNSCLNPTAEMLLEGMKCEELLVFGATLFYAIWKARCRCFFEGEINWITLIRSFNVSVEEFMSTDHLKNQGISIPLSASSRRWCPPQHGFIKMNVDAAYVAGQAAAAMVVRNDQGQLLYLATKLLKCGSSFVAEVEALRWAAEYADQCARRRVEWETDTKEVEEAVFTKEDPTCWYAYYSICSIRKCFDNHGWKVK
ncbi:hypothetical protein FNV43_RR25505 [Rhamnella rubrinervis]|uniref:Uncharacterized protein n=1 Tax=Rhamnella rubrinervis TaxID=2594499 RepID=A0A8K0DNH3_9ROSA|nr:hypothetical protein FNV43_RR25505 [Rhamnella rubrinervis]